MAKSSPCRPSAGRARYAKSRNGCLTCRVRRIRCDETLPYCRNCQSTGRQCEGPKNEKFAFVHVQQTRIRIREQPNNRSRPQNWLSPTQANHDADEQRSFHFFVHRTAPLLAAGALNTAFWSKLVPQTCQFDPVIWNSAITIATLMEHPIGRVHVVQRRGTLVAATPLQRRALQWYSQAIAGMRQRMTDKNALPTALLTCILFACIEIQQGNTQNGLRLVQQGVQLFAGYLNIASKDRPPGYKILDEVVIPFFSQHAIFVATFGVPLLSHAAQATQAMEASPILTAGRETSGWSIGELKQQLYRLLFRSHELISSAALVLDDAPELEAFMPCQMAILADLRLWRDRFDQARELIGASRMEWVTSYLFMHYHVAYIWVSICPSPGETGVDQYTEIFTEIVAHADKYLQARGAEQADSELFTFGAEIIPPLYFTVTKCRHPHLRRQALCLIEHLPKSGTFWANIPVVAILRKLIAFEERRKASWNGSELCLPAPDQRVHHIQLTKLEQSAGVAARFVTFVTNEKGSRMMEEHVVQLDPELRLLENAASLRLDMSPVAFGMKTPPGVFTTTPLVETLV